MKQHVLDIQNLMVHLLRNDNEELGVICVKIVIDINRTYRALLEAHIQPFVSWIIDLYEGMPQVVESTFREGSSSSAALLLPGQYSVPGGSDVSGNLVMIHGMNG